MSTDTELRAAADRNLRQAWRTLAGAQDGTVIEESEQALFVAGDAGVPFFNPAFLKVDRLDPEWVGEQLRRFYGSLGVPYLVWASEGTQPGLVAAAHGLGLAVSQGPPAMVLAPLEPITAVASELVIEPVDDDAGRETAVQLASAGFGMAIELCRRVLSPALLRHPSVRVFIGRVGGEPVSTATLVVTDEVAGVYTVATPPAHRRRGYGVALTAAVIEEGRRRGCTVASLQASAMGAPIYERMGFRHLAGYHHLVGSP